MVVPPRLRSLARGPSFRHVLWVRRSRGVCAIGFFLLLWPQPARAESPPAPWMFRCLRRVSATALLDGASLPVDCGAGELPRTPCAARCEGRCWLRGDFDGDGSAAEVVVAHGERGESTLWIVRPLKSKWRPAAFFP